MGHIRDLTPDPVNRRQHNPRNIGMLVDSLHAVGAARSIVIDEAGTVLAGNGVLEAAAEAGITGLQIVDADGDAIVAVRRRGLTDAQKRALAMYDNRTGELAEWNVDQLKLDSAAGLGLQPFFTDKEIAHLIGSSAATGRTDPDAVPEPRATTIKAGDLFALGPHRLLCGDSTQPAAVQRVLEGVQPVVLLSDPPYCSGGFQEAGRKAGSVGTRGSELVHNDQLSTRGYMALLRTVVANVGAQVVYLFTDWRMWVHLYDVVEASGYGVRNMIVWNKDTPGMGIGWRSQHELILCGTRVSQPFDPSRAVGNVITCARTGNEHHATEKPVDLLATVLDVTDFGTTVCDPFLGSGTTILACESRGRRCFALECDPVYCQVAIDRWEAFTGQRAEQIAEVLT